MAPRPERVLAIDVDPAIVRGIVLTGGHRAIAGGYAQLAFRPDIGPAAVAGRIAAALDVTATLPVVVTCHHSLPVGAAAEIIEQVRSQGFQQVDSVQREDAAHRANPDGDEPDVLVDSEIADGLLTSHAGLTLGTLAPVVGAALGVLGLGAAPPGDDGPVAVWHPDAPNVAGAPATPDPGDAPDQVAAEDEDQTISRLGDQTDLGPPDQPGRRGLIVAPPILDDDVTLGAAEAADEVAAGAVSAGLADDADTTGDSTAMAVTAGMADDADDDLTADGSVAVAAAAAAVAATQVQRNSESESEPEARSQPEPQPEGGLEGTPDTHQAPATVAAVPVPAQATKPTGRPIKPLLMLLAALIGAVVLGLVISQCVGGGDGADDTNIDATTAASADPADADAEDETGGAEAEDAEDESGDAPDVAADTGGGDTETAAGDQASDGSGDTETAAGDQASDGSGDTETAAGDQASDGSGDTETAAGDQASDGSGDTETAAGDQASDGSGDTETAAGDQASDGSDDTETAAGDQASDGSGDTETAAGDQASDGSGDTETAAGDQASDGSDDAENAADAESSVDPLAGLPPLSSLPARGAVFRPPILYLEGPVQTQEQADQLYQRAIEVVGPDNVVNQYVVRPDAPPATNGNVRVEQAVLFESGSALIADEFVPTLELGVAVMTLNPQVTMIVQGHTDSVGSDETNRVLSERRAQAVVDYLAGRGVPLQRLQSVGFGESQPVAANDTAEGRQINRRIEVVLLDLLASQ